MTKPYYVKLVILILILAIGCYIFLKPHGRKSPPARSNDLAAIPLTGDYHFSSSVTTEELGQWHHYIYADAGFSLSFPPEWKLFAHDPEINGADYGNNSEWLMGGPDDDCIISIKDALPVAAYSEAKSLMLDGRRVSLILTKADDVLAAITLVGVPADGIRAADGRQGFLQLGTFSSQPDVAETCRGVFDKIIQTITFAR